MESDPADPSQSQMEFNIGILVPPEIKNEPVNDGFLNEGVLRAIQMDHPATIDLVDENKTEEVSIKIEPIEIDDFDQNVTLSAIPFASGGNELTSGDCSTNIVKIKLDPDDVVELVQNGSTVCGHCNIDFDTNENLQDHLNLAHVRHAGLIERGKNLYNSSKEPAAAGSSTNYKKKRGTKRDRSKKNKNNEQQDPAETVLEVVRVDEIAQSPGQPKKRLIDYTQEKKVDDVNKLEEINSTLILDTNNQIKELGDSNSDLILQLDDLRKEMDREKAQFNVIFNANQVTIQSLQDQKMSSEIKQIELKELINQLQEQNSKLEQNNSNFQTQLTKLTNEDKSLVLNHNKVIQEKFILSQKFDQFVKDSSVEKNQLNSINSQLKLEISSKTENFNVISKKMAEISSKNENFEEIQVKFEKLKKYSGNMEIKISELLLEITSKKENIDELKKYSKEMEIKNCELNDKIIKLEDMNSALILNTNNQIKELGDLNSDLILQLGDLKKELYNEKVQFNAILNDNQASIQCLQDQKITSEKKQIALKELINQLQEQNGKLEQNNSNFRTQLTQLSNEHGSLVSIHNKIWQEKIILSQKFDQFVKDSSLEKVRLNSLNSQLMLEIFSKNENFEVLQRKFDELKKYSEEMERRSRIVN